MADYRNYVGADFSREFLVHYGVGHDKGGNSGRYKWGSGDRPYQRTSMEGKNYGDSSLSKELQKRHKKEARGYQKTLRKLERRRAVHKNYARYAEAEENTKKIKDTIAELEARGYTLKSKEIKHYIDHGEEVIGAVLAGPLGMLVADAMFANTHREEGKLYTVRTPEQSKIDSAKEKEKRLSQEYYDAADKVERSHPDYDKNYNKLYDDMKRKEKAANDAMVERARAQHPDDSDEKIAKRLGFQVDEVSSVPKRGSDSSKPDSKDTSSDTVRAKAQKALNTKEGKRLADKMDSLEEKYLDIAEDDFTPHDDAWRKKREQASREYERAKQQWVRYRDSM